MAQPSPRTYTVRLDRTNWAAISSAVDTFAASKNSDTWLQWAKQVNGVIQNYLAQSQENPVPVSLDEANWNSIKQAILAAHQNSEGFWKQWAGTMVSLIDKAGAPQYQPAPQQTPYQPGGYQPVSVQAENQPEGSAPAGLQMHSIPKCTRCGAVTQWTVGPLFRTLDWVLFLIFLVFAGGGFIYMLIVFLMRNDPNNREKICPHCKAENMWTFLY